MSDSGTCDCCGLRPSIGVASLPGIPMSIQWCQQCVNAGVVPLWAAVANTAMAGGYDQSAEWWKLTVDRTLAYFQKTHTWFAQEVEKSEREMLAELAEDLSDLEKEDPEWPPTS